jgi:hypothetical protein
MASHPNVLKNDPNPGKTFAELDRQVDRTKTGPLWLGDPRVAEMFVEVLKYGA